ncbi:MAG: hypothetical protein AB7O97_07745 [Planctomycetota bacterium]
MHTKTTAPPEHPPAARAPAPQAPAAPRAPAAAPASAGADRATTARERLADAWEWATDGSTPMLLIGATVAFPVTMVFGAMVTWVADLFPLRLLAFAPAFLLFAALGAVGRRTLLAALHDTDDTSELPRPLDLAGQALRTTPQALALGAAFAGPGAAALLLGQAQLGLLLLLAAVFLLPMAAGVLLTTGNWRALSPAPLVAAVRRGGGPYLQVAGIGMALTAPAVLAFALTVDLPAYTFSAIVGALGAGPVLLTARMLGVALQERREQIAAVFALPAARPIALRGARKVAPAPQRRPSDA